MRGKEWEMGALQCFLYRGNGYAKAKGERMGEMEKRKYGFEAYCGTKENSAIIKKKQKWKMGR